MSGQAEHATGFTPLRGDLLALVALLVVLPLTSFGATSGVRALWLAGLAVLVGASILTLFTEFGLDGGQ